MNPWFCTLCDELVEPEDILTGEHCRVMHPMMEIKGGAVPELWPDGEPVVFDETVDEEFR